MKWNVIIGHTVSALIFSAIADIMLGYVFGYWTAAFVACVVTGVFYGREQVSVQRDIATALKKKRTDIWWRGWLFHDGWTWDSIAQFAGPSLASVLVALLLMMDRWVR